MIGGVRASAAPSTDPGAMPEAHAAAQAARRAVSRFTLNAAHAKTKSHSTLASPRSLILRRPAIGLIHAKTRSTRGRHD